MCKWTASFMEHAWGTSCILFVSIFSSGTEQPTCTLWDSRPTSFLACQW